MATWVKTGSKMIVWLLPTLLVAQWDLMKLLRIFYWIFPYQYFYFTPVLYWCQGASLKLRIEGSLQVELIFGKVSFSLALLKKDLFIHERNRETGRDIGRGRSKLSTESPMWDSILGPWDHTLSKRQTLNRWATRASLLGRPFNLARAEAVSVTMTG